MTATTPISTARHPPPSHRVDDAGTVEYLHTDLLGSVRLITDQDGGTAATSTFDEFGNRVHHTGTSDSAFGFTGAWTDADTGLVHLRARDYDPATGQFLTVDPAVDQTRQPYAYTGNNPLTRTDPTGLDAMSDAIGRGAMALILGPGSLRVMDELNAGTDLWSSINMGYNPVYAAIERYDSFRASGNDWWAAGVMAFNPVYDVIAGFDKGLTGIQNECVEDTVTGFTQTLAGLVGTGLIAAGGVGTIRSLSTAGTTTAAAPAMQVTLKAGKQDIHIPGTKNFDPSKSEITVDPQTLLSKVGTGTPVNSVAAGSAGYRERIDFGYTIGRWTDKKSDVYSDTSVGIVHYAKNGMVHIVPGRPTQ